MSFQDLVNEAYSKGMAPYSQAVEAIKEAAQGKDVINSLDSRKQDKVEDKGKDTIMEDDLEK